MILSGAWKLPKMEKCWNNPSKQRSLLPPRRCINYQYLHNGTDVYSCFWLLSSQQCNIWGGNDYHGRNTMDTICNLYKTIQKKVQNYPEKGLMRHSTVAIGGNTSWLPMRRGISYYSSQHHITTWKGKETKRRGTHKKWGGGGWGQGTEKGKVDQQRILVLKRSTCEVQDTVPLQNPAME